MTTADNNGTEPMGVRATLTEMSFFGHLEELRKRIMFALLGLMAGCIISGIFADQIINYALMLPAQAAGLPLQNRLVFGQVFLYFKVILASGVVVAMPFILFQLWKFVAPGLYAHERNWAGKITAFTSICFLSGVAFAYWVMIPSMLKFTAHFNKFGGAENKFDITEYFGFITTTAISAGLIFELPMIAYVLTRVGMLTAEWMRNYRRYAIVLILIVAAVLTPSPDPVNQLIFAAPLWVLYEISIIISKFAVKKRTEPTE
ncbi:hypothetical protein MASR2M18_16080 [Ignavibacteria bacterium]|nr:twin-arginine translocase subunit TatC [Bacteroidota bacterium]